MPSSGQGLFDWKAFQEMMDKRLSVLPKDGGVGDLTWIEDYVRKMVNRSLGVPGGEQDKETAAGSAKSTAGSAQTVHGSAQIKPGSAQTAASPKKSSSAAPQHSSAPPEEQPKDIPVELFETHRSVIARFQLSGALKTIRLRMFVYGNRLRLDYAGKTVADRLLPCLVQPERSRAEYRGGTVEIRMPKEAKSSRGTEIYMEYPGGLD